jgi:uncharacterized protein YutE (UPF0331/DUF86 family)
MKEGSIRRLEKFNVGLEKLKRYSKLSLEEILKKPEIQDSIERSLQVCAEALADIGRKVISRMNWRIPKDYKDVVEVLRENKVVSKSLATELKEIFGLRNILVHFYADVKIEIIHDNLKNYLNSLKKGMEALVKFCKEKGIDP